MENDFINEKKNCQNILLEIDILKKSMNDLSNNVRSEKIESFIESMSYSITELQNKTEDYYSERFDKKIDTINE